MSNCSYVHHTTVIAKSQPFFSYFSPRSHTIYQNSPASPSMNIEIEREKLILFTKVGAIVLTSIALLSASLLVYPKSAETLSSSVINEKELPIYCVEQEKPLVSISFDAAWGNDDTRKLLEVLKKHQVKATFFMTGGWIEKYPDDVKAIAADGHDLGNHSENHKQMSQLSAEQCKEEIMKPHEKVKKLTGKDMILFRPPYGDYNDTLIQTTRECNYYPIQWDVDSLDWKDYDAATIIRRVTEHKHLGNGSIILCHNGAKHTAEALDELLSTLKKKGYQLVPISQLIMKENYKINTEGRQIKAAQ